VTAPALAGGRISIGRQRPELSLDVVNQRRERRQRTSFPILLNVESQHVSGLDQAPRCAQDSLGLIGVDATRLRLGQ
jgi:hypothetical protein